MNFPGISIIVPFYNEKNYIEIFLNSIQTQNYKKNLIELIFIDGNSNDNTRKLIEDFAEKNKELDIVILNNPEQKIPISLNMAIKKAKKNIICRMDVHAEYPSNYLTDCVKTLLTNDAHNVGGRLITLNRGNGVIAKVIRTLTSSVFGVGNSKFRTSAKTSYVDTVLYGCFYKNVIDKVGMFDERIFRNQDNEFNYRLRKSGFKLLQNSNIVVKYYNVNSLGKIISQSFRTGLWNSWTIFIQPFSLRMRHFVPLFFVLILITSSCLSFVSNLFLFSLLISLSIYFFTSMIFSFYYGLKEGILISLLLIPMFFLYHFTYGTGSIFGFLFLPFKLKAFNKKKRGW